MTEPAPRPWTVKAARFALVGLANAAIDFAVFSLAYLGGIPAIAANVLGWLVAVTFSYVINRRFTFEPHRNLALHVSIGRFLASGAFISLGISTAVLWLAAPLIGAFPAKIAGTVIAAALNFLAAFWAIENRIPGRGPPEGQRPE